MEKNNNPLSTVSKWIIKLYQAYISPFLPKSCRYYPTCSEYALIALEQHGFVKGAWLSIKRILKCNPFSHGGFDPVPDSPHRHSLHKEK